MKLLLLVAAAIVSAGIGSVYGSPEIKKGAVSAVTKKMLVAVRPLAPLHYTVYKHGRDFVKTPVQ